MITRLWKVIAFKKYKPFYIDMSEKQVKDQVKAYVLVLFK